MRNTAFAKGSESRARSEVLRNCALRCVSALVGLEWTKRALLCQLSYAPTLVIILYLFGCRDSGALALAKSACRLHEKGKMDPKGAVQAWAVQAWEELLPRNPNYSQKQPIQEYIDRAKQHAKG